jgi:hypothetical protein
MPPYNYCVGSLELCFLPLHIQNYFSGFVFSSNFICHLSAQTCGNGRRDPGEECDGGLGCFATNCTCAPDFEPLDPPEIDCQRRMIRFVRHNYTKQSSYILVLFCE